MPHNPPPPPLPSPATSPAQAIIPYTGFYTLDPSIGSFVLVDTNFAAMAGAPAPVYGAQVSLSTDGKTSTVYVVGSAGCTFDDTTLTITDGATTVATLAFATGGGTTSVSGTIGAATVSGETPFAPIELSVFAGTYYTQTGAIGSGPSATYLYAPKLKIDADGTVSYAFGTDGVWTTVPNYWYDYAMFVVSFAVDGKPMTFEMGTSAGWGRVAGDAGGGSMLVSIQQNQPIPSL